MVNVGGFSLLVVLWSLSTLHDVVSHGDHPFARIAIDKTVLAVTNATAIVEVSPSVLGLGGQSFEWVNVNVRNPNPSSNDWIGVFSPSNFSASTCAPDNPRVVAPLLCTSPIKYKYVQSGNPNYQNTGNASVKLQLINQRSDFSFGLFTGGLSKPKLVTVSNTIAFANPNAPNFPRLAQGKLWNEMIVTWTSGYSLRESEPFVEWGKQGEKQRRSPATTLTFNRNSMCGAPAKTVGWRDPGYFHTSFMTGLWSNSLFTYKLGHKLRNNTIIWSQVYQFKSSPYPGQSSLQRVIIFGDMGKDEADGSNEYNQFQRGSLNTTKQLIEDLKNLDVVFHIGDISYANGYLSQWDQFTSQIEPIASSVPYMIASGNHERDWPNSGSFYENYDSGGECGVVAETMFYVPAQIKTKLWYSVDYGMFRFCIADTENDWRHGSEQYKFIEGCLASVNRQKQPWLVFLAHRVLGYSSSLFYYIQGYAEPMGRESLENLWQKYNVDIAIFGHAHNYERTCPMYQSKCMYNESNKYSGSLNGTIHVVAGGGGASLSEFAPIKTAWSVFRDYDYGFLKLTAFNHSKLLFEYKKSRDGKVLGWGEWNDMVEVAMRCKTASAGTPVLRPGNAGMWIYPVLFFLLLHVGIQSVTSHGYQTFSKISILETVFALDDAAYVKASPLVLGLKGQTSEWLTLTLHNPKPSIDDWIGVFSPANFSASTCTPESSMVSPPLLCTAPIKYQYANYSNPSYKNTGKALLKFQLINQRSDFSFALFTGGLSKPKLVAVSNSVVFANPNAPNYPRLAQGKTWNEMTVTWTSGYGIDEAEPFVEWGRRGEEKQHSPAETLTIDRNSLCGAPARTVGWRDPGFIHTGFLKGLWPKSVYTYKLGHKLLNGSVIWSHVYQFKSSPYPGQNSLQRVIIFGDMGKDEVDGSNDYNNYQHGSLNTTKQLIGDLKNYDIVFHIGDICYANGYLSQWDQFTAQVELIASAVPYMIASGNHERDWPNSGSFYENNDSGGECGVLAETMFYVPVVNQAKFWYSTDYGMFKFCIANTEHDWREGTEQYKFIEECLATVDRQKQPWLIFLAHRVLGYSSTSFYAVNGTFGEPMGRESLQKLWKKYKVDIAIYGHAHNYERTCPVYESSCTSNEKHAYKGSLNGTIHVVAGGGGASLTNFANTNTTWSLVKDLDYGFLKLTAFDHSNLLFEYKKSSNGKVFDSFKISRDYKDILACTADSCPPTTLPS
ncbi:hypothetical protein E3N88_45913 [Mikania micrantha]|uniref:Purple acid phosphatase n=1 Tax=Mikania micrantha TaxID=192012 RepID=A0A5N6L818_9ASTR|nr:hypothetical protein E3N88_45913 [Mikania micrantha]